LLHNQSDAVVAEAEMPARRTKGARRIVAIDVTGLPAAALVVARLHLLTAQ
jgi:hypothetical protein